MSGKLLPLNNFKEYKPKTFFDGKLSINGYIENIRSYLRDMIGDYKTSTKRKILVIMKMNFM